MRIAIVLLLAVIVFIACGGDDSPTGPQAIAPTWDNVQRILNRNCAYSNCHGGINTQPANGPMNLTAGASYGQLLGESPLFLGQPSSQRPQLLRVKPGDPDSSYLVAKLLGYLPADSSAIVGNPMPLCCNPLPSEEFMAVRGWIAAGALRN